MKLREILTEKDKSIYPIKYKLLKSYPGMEHKPGTIFIKTSKGTPFMVGNHSSTEWNEKYFNSVSGFFKKIK